MIVGSAILIVVATGRLVTSGYQSILIWSSLALVILLTSARHPIQFLGTGTGISVSEALIFLAVIMLGPYHGALLGAVDMALAGRRFKIRPSLYGFNVAHISISVFVAGDVYNALVVILANHPITTGVGQRLLEFGIPLVSMALADYMLQLLMVWLLSRVTVFGKYADRFRATWPWEPASFLASAVVAGLTKFACDHGLITAAVTLAMVIPVLIAIYYTFKTYHDKLAEQEKHYRKLTGIYDSILEMLAMAIDAKDDVTHDHIQRVKHFARRMGEIIGLSEMEIEALKAGALLHDIGKIGVPAYILNKPGKLTEHEFEQMKMHTIIGADMLSNVDFRYPVVPIVRHHHERWDGRGYPDGLKEEDIPITARILTLVDNYDALRSDRPYKKGMTREEALAYIEHNAAVFFDPGLVEIFLSVVDQLEAEVADLKFSHQVRPSQVASTALASARPAAGFATAPTVDRAAAALNSIAETNQRVTGLYEMSRTLSSFLSIEDTVAILANRLSKLIPFTTCAVSLFDATRSEFEIVHAVGRHADRFLRRRQPAEAGITGWVITNQRAMYNTNPVLDLGFLGSSDAAEYKSVIVFPLLKNEEALGAMALYSSELESYGSEHIQLMESVSQPAADAVFNARAYEQAQRDALTDAVSGFPNTRALATRFEQERARCQRLGIPLSVMTIRIDYLGDDAEETRRSFDQVFVRTGKCLAGVFRETDFLARHSANAFVAVLPGIARSEAHEIRSRVRGAVQQVDSVSLTFGMSTWPESGTTLAELIECAYNEAALERDHIGDLPPSFLEDEMVVR
jgi:diguanylate cyclase (GGDEF)-like protein/putative nucleotidyltransferase with HDIG domain